MYEVLKANVVKNGKPIKTYDVNIKTENIEEVRQEIIKRYLEEYSQDVSVDLQYKEFSQKNG